MQGEMREKHLQVLDGGDPSESLTRNSLNLILAQVPGERNKKEKEKEKDIRICLKPLHILGESILRKMDGLLPPLWNNTPLL